MSETFKSSYARLKRAQNLIRELKDILEPIGHRDNYRMARYFDPNGPCDVYKLKLIKPIPEEASVIASDAANNLRSALDNAASDIGFITLGKRTKNMAFPFWGTAKEFENRKFPKPRPSQDILDPVFAVMVAFKPYKGGNNALWAINKLSNTNKHEILVPVAVSVGKIRMGLGRIEGPGTLFPANSWDRKNNEIALLSCAFGSTPEVKFEVPTFIGLCEVDDFGGPAPISIFDDMSSVVESILMALEAECRRLNIFK